MRSRSISSVAGGLEYTCFFDATPQKKVARCEIRASWGAIPDEIQDLKPYFQTLHEACVSHY